MFMSTSRSIPRVVWIPVLLAAILPAMLGACTKKGVVADAKPNAPSQTGQAQTGQSQTGQVNKDANVNRGPGGQRGGPAPAVITAKVQEANFSGAVEALGTAKANEAIDIVAKGSNRVTAIHFREGQSVLRGQVLLELDADEARADLQHIRDSRSRVKNGG